MADWKRTRFSVLDLALVKADGTVADAFRGTLDLARHVEGWGYTRFWLAEHHNMGGIASAATSVLIGYVAGGTSTLRVGSGGIMLPNHSSLVIAEHFGTLESLYPGRIDLGVGRAPGSDGLTARALRRGLGNEDDFPRQVQELLAYLGPRVPGQRVRAVPGEGTNVPGCLDPAPTARNLPPGLDCDSPSPAILHRSRCERLCSFIVRSSGLRNGCTRRTP